jgi:hypothetical protein
MIQGRLRRSNVSPWSSQVNLAPYKHDIHNHRQMSSFRNHTLSSFKAAIMTCVSSECSKFFSLQVPFPSAASTKALFEILLEPGVDIFTGFFVGKPGRTLTAPDRF